jgi:hypothetical protein
VKVKVKVKRKGEGEGEGEGAFGIGIWLLWNVPSSIVLVKPAVLDSNVRWVSSIEPEVCFIVVFSVQNRF